MSQASLRLACDCLESGGDCGTWLELTPEGILCLEDKDGLRVSILLPDWLDEAMRTALLAHAMTDEAAVKRPTQSPLTDDVPF